MLSGLPENLPGLVERRFIEARDSGSLSLSATQLTTLYATGGIPYQLRFCPSLAKKPASSTHADRKQKEYDPFDHPSQDLLIGPCGPTHFLVLNKYPVIRNHFILATKAFKRQTDLLERDDLGATYACLRAWRDRPHHQEQRHEGHNASAIPGVSGGKKGERRLFAFFNSGQHSGASQPHRHVQFLPVEAMRGDQEPPNGDLENSVSPSRSCAWEPLIDVVLSRQEDPSSTLSGFPQLAQIQQSSFAYFARTLPAEPTPDMLHDIYLELYRQAAAVAERRTPLGDFANRDNDGRVVNDDDSTVIGKPAKISYNLAMTLSGIMVCPRRGGEASLLPGSPSSPTADTGNTDAGLGSISLNGTILAGTFMVKAQNQWDILRTKPELLASILAVIGFPPPLPSPI